MGLEAAAGMASGEDNRIVIVTPFAGSEEVVDEVPPVPEVQPAPKVPQVQEVRSEEAQQAAIYEQRQHENVMEAVEALSPELGIVRSVSVDPAQNVVDLETDARELELAQASFRPGPDSNDKAGAGDAEDGGKQLQQASFKRSFVAQYCVEKKHDP